MPKVPTYDSPLVAPQPLGAPRTPGGGAVAAVASTAGADATAIGRGLSSAGANLTDIAIHMQEQKNVEKVQAAQAAHGEQMLQWMTEARTKRVGHLAEGVTKDFDEWFDKSSSETLSSFDNDTQRRGFQRLQQKQKLAAKQDLAGFELSEGRKARKAAYDAANVNAVNIASTAASPQLLAQQRENVLNSIATHAALNGWGEEEVQAERGKWLSALHLQRMQNLVSHDPEGAREYFSSNKHEIKGEFHDQADKLLKTGELKNGSLKLQFELEKLPGLGAQTKEADRLFKDGKISAEMRDAVVSRLEHAYSKRKAMQAEGEGRLLDQVVAFHVSNPSASIHDLDPKVLNSLTRAGKLGQAVNILNGEVKSHFDTLMGLYETAKTDPKAFKEIPLKTYQGVLSRSDLMKLEGMQRDEKKLKAAGTLDQQLSDAHDTMGWGAGDRKKKGVFDAMVREEVDREQARIGKELDFDEQRKIISRMMMTGKKEGDWFFKSHFFEAKAEGKEAGFVPDDASLVSRFRQLKGRNPTKQEIDAIRAKLK